MKASTPLGIKKLLEGNAEVFITAVDAGRAIADALKIERMDAMRILWEAQKDGSVAAKIIDGNTCVDARGVRALIRTWRQS
jgi:hypothetical protein